MFFLWFSPSLEAQRKYKVVLDAGHGGKDPGNLGNGYREKKIVLSVVLKVGKQLEREKDIEVIYTRKSDRFVELHNRAKIANSNNADLFVSIHCDAFKRAKAYGAGTFVLGLSGNNMNMEIAKRENAVIKLEKDYKSNYDYDPNSPESVIGLSVLQEENLDESLAFAGLVQKGFVASKRYDRSVKQANFLVLRETIMPSVLIELGFLTNKAEGKFLNSKSGQTKMAKAIAKAIIKYVQQSKLNTVKGDVITVEIENPKNDAKTPNKQVLPFVELKVQIAASKNNIPRTHYNFKGLKNVEMNSSAGLYKYFYGKTTNFKAAKEALEKVKELGYKSAFLVAFKNGTRIPLSEAFKKP